jgi:predicted RNA binding protein YcfA (HicA-like mRNA interferase family)
MPKKIRELISQLEAAGFINRGGKGSHRNFRKAGHPSIIISGKPGDDAKPYQERDVTRAIGDTP